jgi:phenylalanyl-tRNA synthetase beta chain
MRIPLSWLKDFVDITISPELLAERLTLAGMEVGKIEYIGVPQGEAPAGINVPPSDHLVWDREKIVLGKIIEVLPHPNADKLVLAMVEHGTDAPEQVVTGAPNLYEYKGAGKLNPPLWTALAREGAEVYDGHSEEVKRMVLKERNLRGIPNRCMVCSEKELGMPELIDGIILLDDPGKLPGTPFVDVLGDVIFDIELTPNLARCYSILGIAREVAALTGQQLRERTPEIKATGAGIQGQVSIHIENAELNPRFTLMLIRNVEIKPSPGWMQRRLIAAGERPINNIVDITNYVMLEIGQPLHAFDYDFLLQRSGGKPPTIITRTAKPGETMKTLDGEEHKLEDFNEMVCDSEGILSLAGVMGGDESKIQDTTKNVLLEAANWNYINVRKTMTTQKMTSGAGLRFSRGIHPAMAARGVRRGIELMQQLGGGEVAQGIVDNYPLPAPTVHVDLPLSEIKRLLGVAISLDDAADILRRLQFTVQVDGDTLRADVPDHRVDINTGIIGQADLCEEIARIYGYDRLPNTLVNDMLPPQNNNYDLMREEQARDLLANLGLHEVINYRLTTVEAEARLNAPNLPPALPDAPYLGLANPISADKAVLRHSILNNVLENIAANQNHAQRQQIYEIGAVFIPREGERLPDEQRRLAVAISGVRAVSGWQEGQQGAKNAAHVDFYDLKGIVEGFLRGLHVGEISFKAAQFGAFHPGRSAQVLINGKQIGVMGELHPVVRERYDIAAAVFAADFDLDALLAPVRDDYRTQAVPTQPALYQDIALIVDAKTSAAELQRVIVQAGGDLLESATLFDVYQGESIPAGKKSLAYALVFRAADRTLTDKDVAKVQQKIVQAAERQLGAALRS